MDKIKDIQSAIDKAESGQFEISKWVHELPPIRKSIIQATIKEYRTALNLYAEQVEELKKGSYILRERKNQYQHNWHEWENKYEELKKTHISIEDCIEIIKKGLPNVLNHYRCSRTFDEDEEHLELVDKLSAPNDSTIKTGKEEIEFLIDEIYNELINQISRKGRS